jgi:hypothetical protein
MVASSVVDNGDKLGKILKKGLQYFWSRLIHCPDWSRIFMLNIMTFDAKVMIYHA